MLSTAVKNVENQGFAVVFFPFCGFVATELKNGFADGFGLLKTPSGHQYLCRFANGFISENQRLYEEKDRMAGGQSDCVLKVLCDIPLSTDGLNDVENDTNERVNDITRQFEMLMKSSATIGVQLTDEKDVFFGLLPKSEHRPIGIKLSGGASLEAGEFRGNLRLKNGRKIGPLADVCNIKNYEIVACIEHDFFASATQVNVNRLVEKKGKTVKKLGDLKLDLESFASIELCSFSDEVINEDILKFNGAKDQSLLREFVSWKLTRNDVETEGFIESYLGKWLGGCDAVRLPSDRADRKTKVKKLTDGRTESNPRQKSTNSLFGSLIAANRQPVESPFKVPSKYSIINGNSEDFDDKVDKRHGRKFINLPPKTEFIQTKKLARRAPASPSNLPEKRSNFENRKTVDNNHVAEAQSTEEQSVRFEKLKRLFSPANGSEPTKLALPDQSDIRKTFSTKMNKGHSMDLALNTAQDIPTVSGEIKSQPLPPDPLVTPKQQPQLCLQVTPSKIKELSIQCTSIMTGQKSEGKSVAVDTCPSEENLNTSEQELTGYATDRSEKACEFMTFHKVGNRFKKKGEGMC